jgi:hypothetical protein
MMESGWAMAGDSLQNGLAQNADCEAARQCGGASP